MESEELDYSLESDEHGENSQPFSKTEYNTDCIQHTERTYSLFDGCCIKYLKTSECDNKQCSLSHEVGKLIIGMKYNTSVHETDDNFNLRIEVQLKMLQQFLSDAFCPPLTLIKEACCVFASFKATDAILSMSNLLTRQYAESNSDYMQEIFLTLLYPLKQIYRSQDTAVAKILGYICNECIVAGWCEAKILDNIVKIIEISVKIDDKLRVFGVLMTIQCYVFPQMLLDSVFLYTMRKPQSWLRTNYGTFKMLASVLLRDSQEESFFHIWKSLPHLVAKLQSYLQRQPMYIRLLRKKLAKFKKRSVDHCTTPPSPREQTYGQQMSYTVTNHRVTSGMHNGTEEHVSQQSVHTYGPYSPPAGSLYQKIGTLNSKNNTDSTSYGMYMAKCSDNTGKNILHEDDFIKKVSAQCDKGSTSEEQCNPEDKNASVPLLSDDSAQCDKGSTSEEQCNPEDKNANVPLLSDDSKCYTSSQYGIRPDDWSNTVSSQPSFADFEREAFAVQHFLNNKDLWSVLKSLYKWQNSQYSSGLTKHIFNVLVSMDTAEKCSSLCLLQGLLTVAKRSGKLSIDMKRSLASISVNVFFHMVSVDNWKDAYEIYKLTMKYDLPYFKCEVYRDSEYSSARRILAFVEVCMVNKDFEQAVSLLVDYNILDVDCRQWCLQSTDQDYILRNELISALMGRIVKSDLRLVYKFLMYIMEAQKDIETPINLVKNYELILRKLLDESNETTALQLFKDVSSYHQVPIIYDRGLCRALVEICETHNEIVLAKLLVKKGRFIGTYPMNSNSFSVTINSNFTQHEMRLLVQEALSVIGKQYMVSLKAGGQIDSDLQFTVVETRNEINIPALLSNVNTSVPDAKNRLISSLHSDFYPCLYINSLQEDSPNVVVQKCVLTEYFSHYFANTRSDDNTKKRS